ncbi:hypothetical protein [Streptomyces sp. NPDC018000]|uniref:hypothetical protein n=1 Tax=Streptomyces sp. NPDC018000 TaxID=3365028 RepID=UPI0037A0C926
MLITCPSRIKAEPTLRLLLSGTPMHLGPAKAQVGRHVRWLAETLLAWAARAAILHGDGHKMG